MDHAHEIFKFLRDRGDIHNLSFEGDTQTDTVYDDLALQALLEGILEQFPGRIYHIILGETPDAAEIDAIIDFIRNSSGLEQIDAFYMMSENSLSQEQYSALYAACQQCSTLKRFRHNRGGLDSKKAQSPWTKIDDTLRNRRDQAEVAYAAAQSNGGHTPPPAPAHNSTPSLIPSKARSRARETPSPVPDSTQPVLRNTSERTTLLPTAASTNTRAAAKRPPPVKQEASQPATQRPKRASRGHDAPVAAKKQAAASARRQDDDTRSRARTAKSIDQMTNEEICDLLRANRLKRFVPVFEELEIRGNDIANISDEDYKDTLKMANFEKERFKRAVQELLQ
eukprot:TRINITY_DN9425_c0_g2_i1.p1 TRINITY_DN9425_c0_g2~~TRINITY_DN9425_c0_g2_i1.p1  ORF type:complete len:378 (+),score=43.83 TRINITY_DN9425_c0_g2_i1:120-1136(+)